VNDRQLATPDFPKEQVAALIVAVLSVAAAAGFDISKDLQDRIITLVTVAYPLVALALAHIRHGRARAMIVPPKGEVEATTRVARKPVKR
jgi:hypothetical protein